MCKWSLCKLEGLSKPDMALLFTSLSSPAPKEDSARLSVYAPSRPGLSEQDPIVLVVESEKRSHNPRRRSCRSTLMILISITARLVNVSYLNSALISFAVYYRVYSSEGGDKKAKTSFDKSDISLGHINTLSIR